MKFRWVTRTTHSATESPLAKLMLASALLHFLTGFAGKAVADDVDHVWQALHKAGHVALLRHALAPGTGDPADFRLGDCSTQRNLSEVGRLQAKNIGQLLRDHGIDSAQVYSSQWCRCLETARLLGFDTVQELPALNSFFQEFQRKQPQTEALLAWLSELPADKPPVILVTHQVNITALTGVFPASGELVVVQVANGKIEVAGSVATAY